MREEMATFSRRMVLVFGLLALAAPAAPHDTWLLPAKFMVPAGTSVPLDMTSGMGFPKNESAVAPDRIAQSGVRSGRTRGVLKVGRAEAGALRLEATLREEGVAVLWAVSRPRTIDLKPDQVEHYLEEIGAQDSVGKDWVARGRPAWRETYSKIAKTYVRVGSAGEDAGWRDPVGLPLELVPAVDPTKVHAGDAFVLRLLLDGKPLGGVAVTAVGGEGKPEMRRTDADGNASFTVSRPGPWLFKATRLTGTGSAGTEWEAQFTTVTVEAKPPR